MSIHYQDELLDLVDDTDTIIGVMGRNEVYTHGLHNFRVINVFIKNSANQLFIPRRQSHKRLFPLGLDVSCGGHVTSGETYDEAFRKEVSEELNLNADAENYRILGKLTPHQDGVHAFMTVYEIFSDTTPDYNSHDFIEHFWLTPTEIMERLDQGDLAKDDLARLIKKFYLS
jgi:isopentenyldiphosphate isomerase